jgi:hypothetical protein
MYMRGGGATCASSFHASAHTVHVWTHTDMRCRLLHVGKVDPLRFGDSSMRCVATYSHVMRLCYTASRCFGARGPIADRYAPMRGDCMAARDLYFCAFLKRRS